MDLILTGQSDIHDVVAPKLLQLKKEMDKRKAIWDRLPIASRKLWSKNADDPIMAIAVDTYNYLSTNFFKSLEEAQKGPVTA